MAEETRAEDGPVMDGPKFLCAVKCLAFWMTVSTPCIGLPCLEDSDDGFVQTALILYLRPQEI